MSRNCSWFFYGMMLPCIVNILILMNTSVIRHNPWDELAIQSEVKILYGQRSVNGKELPC
jgi:hypothetical protein